MPRTLPGAIAFLLGFWVALWLSPLCVQVAGAQPAPCEDLERELYREVASLRAENRLVPLDRRPALDRAARDHAADMARRGYLAHLSPEGDDPVDRLRRAGLSGFTLAAENIGRTSRSNPVREIVEGWLASPVHRRNLMTPPFNATGVGVARARDGALVFTQLYVSYPRRIPAPEVREPSSP